MKKISLLIFLIISFSDCYCQYTKTDSISVMGQRFIGTRPSSLLFLSPSFCIGKRIDKDSTNEKNQKYALFDFQYNAGIVMLANMIADDNSTFKLISPISFNFGYSIIEYKKKKENHSMNETQIVLGLNYAKYKDGLNAPTRTFVFTPIQLNYVIGSIKIKENTFDHIGLLLGFSLGIYHFENKTDFRILNIPLIGIGIGFRYRVGSKLKSNHFRLKNVL